MPSEDVEITLSEADPYWSGSLFMAVLAYPHPDERTQRDKFHRALIRRTLHFRMESDPKWAQSLTSIRPAYLSVDDQHEKTFSAGQERIHRRSTVAAYVVMPHLETLVSGRIARRNGFVPTTKNMILQATYALGLSENSRANVSDDDWRPLKPVAHAMCALIAWNDLLWPERGLKPEEYGLMEFLMQPEYVEDVVNLAEHFRTQVVTIKAFKIFEEQTIRLTAKWI